MVSLEIVIDAEVPEDDVDDIGGVRCTIPHPPGVLEQAVSVSVFCYLR